LSRRGHHTGGLSRDSGDAFAGKSGVSKVALIFPYFRTRSSTEILFPPLGIASLAGQLRRRGVETKVFDGTFGTLEQLREALDAYQPEIVGISSMVSLTGNTLRVAALVREILPYCLLVAGGPLPTVFPRRYTSHVDVVFRGEADVSFPQFCVDFFAHGVSRATMRELSLDSYAGLFVSGNGLQVDNPTRHHRESEVRTFPPPDRSDFDHVAYQKASLERTGAKATSIITTYGCPFGCDFCSKPVFGSHIRRRDLDVVLAEIEEIRGLGYDTLWIADDTFTLDLPWLEEFCRRMLGRGMSWSCLSRANGIDAATVRLMKRAGCRRVYLGLESGSQTTLQLMNKQILVADGERAAHLFSAAGIEVAAFFIVGYPGESTAAIEETFGLALALPLEEISFNVPMPLPGSALFDRLGAPDEGRDWTEENEITFVYPSAIDERWLRGRIDETMRTFARRRRDSVAPLAQAPEHLVGGPLEACED
jgi:anaerobic magnesium-protoporphyrin IX monomethyl ester cyclase